MSSLPIVVMPGVLTLALAATAAPDQNGPVLSVNPPHIAQNSSIRYDYDIVYVRAPRHGDDKSIPWAEVVQPLNAEPGSDLMLLHPDGTEDVLVAAGRDAITDPFVSFDGEWVYYAHLRMGRLPGYDRPMSVSSDIFKIHVKTKKIVPLTQQVCTPNTGVVGGGSKVFGVHNLAPCPLPGGRVVFTSNRNGFAPAKDYTPTVLQIYVMDDDGSNVELIGHLNVNSALHPTVLRDGRVMFSSFETQGLRGRRQWAVWTINPDGTQWGPLFSALGPTGETVFHFMTQLSDGNVVVEEYYNLNNKGFGTYYKVAPSAPPGLPYFGPAYLRDPRNAAYNYGGVRIPFSPYGLEWLTTFCTANDTPARLSDPKDQNSPRVGKVTHPSAAPDNHLLTVWSPGPVNSNGSFTAINKNHAIDAGIYLIKNGRPVSEPGQMLLIKNDPAYNEQWPRALVPYKRIHGVDEPAVLAPLANDGKASPHLPEGTPYGLVGTSSLYKRESYPNGLIPPGKVTAGYAGGNDPFQGLGALAYNADERNWFFQGADACRYDNSEIHAIRILITEPTTDPRLTGQGTRRWWNAANERLRILGEFPVRKFSGDRQPTDPDGNPDTSFLAKVPGDVAWTFQTLDKHGMVLNMAQTWHQVRPGEIRNDCGGCHAHSQKPTPFRDTAAAKPDYEPFDLAVRTPLLTAKEHDESGKKWDKDDSVGIRYVQGVKNVEYYRDIQPIFARSCVACHTEKAGKPAANLVLDDETFRKGAEELGRMSGPPGKVPGTYFRLALDQRGTFGHKSPLRGWAVPQVSRYVRLFQARRSLLMWKVFGRRLDGWSNDDFATEAVPGDPNSLQYKGKPVDRPANNRGRINLAYTGSIMPPPEAVAGTYEGSDGKKIKVAPLSDEDRRTLARWIDLGCPIDLDFRPGSPEARGSGWLQDDNRPTLTLTYPRRGANRELKRILLGMHDYDSGLDLDSFHASADFAVDGVAAGEELAGKFKPLSPGVWQYQLATPLTRLVKGKLTVSVRDRQGNATVIERSFSVTPER